MRQVPVTIAWMVNAFENSSEHSEYYLDMQTGDIKYFSPMDFPEHAELIKKLDRQTDRYIRLPKLDRELSVRVEREFAATVPDPSLRSLLENALANGLKFRNALMEHEEERRRWYKFQNEKYEEYLRRWFREKGIELVDRPAGNIRV
ncbi:MAG: hypothetical protein HPY89_09985 [Pelotomaculum sp.]|uniref:Uncharacterized protein n=1 Tax=Pelotomaculum thermopropionicum (strain DSM 13744 / JCM 10971 / SI) TaxID=370438 RepID=A5D665_PELTS|nr:hypothetical protein [Pelotomaculum sp.]BAF58253.1 hypothetical protein PTH_0072 [Pelotomaculum thermopropionicum SI]